MSTIVLTNIGSSGTLLALCPIPLPAAPSGGQGSHLGASGLCCSHEGCYHVLLENVS
jgi:hypothetical protein